ncbi:MAG: hypothetical protein A4E49_00159 [Methanosaeta sp. PtaU1.Bin112]|nr:MAG: hypothetical protein A4E49_00159 [Methanosaeta sp. PtaU1.Bin112]
MSAVRDYYKDHRSWNDDLHRLLDREPSLLAQLPALRARALGTCGAVAGKSGVIELMVADPAAWDAIAKEQATLQEKLDAISRAVAEIDAIFAEIEAAGIDCTEKTPGGIVGVDMSRRIPVTDPDTGTNVDRFGRKIPSQHNPQTLEWMQRAEKALKEAQATVG